jgi:hypothetical protein
MTLVRLTNELLDLCRSTQTVYLSDEAVADAASDADPMEGEREEVACPN